MRRRVFVEVSLPFRSCSILLNSECHSCSWILGLKSAIDVKQRRLYGTYNTCYTTILIFNLSPFTISSCRDRNSGMSQVQLIYLPASQSRFSLAKKTIVSAAISGLSVKPEVDVSSHTAWNLECYCFILTSMCLLRHRFSKFRHNSSRMNTKS